MYLSFLLINVGDNPDHPRPGRLWLRNIYHVHQRLCMAFPSASRKSDDAEFLKPFKPEDFASGHVHIPRGTNAGFLYRVDPQPGGSVVILVQSALKPDWDYAFHNAGFLLAAPLEDPKVIDLSFAKDQLLQFRLVANPTKRMREKSCDATGAPVSAKWIGKRVPVPRDRLFEWLASRAETAGFSVMKESVVVQPGYIYFNKPKHQRNDEPEEEIKDKQSEKGRRLNSVRYDGVLEVTDPDRFQKTLAAGIGPGKAFGFGLLSVAPVKDSDGIE